MLRQHQDSIDDSGFHGTTEGYGVATDFSSENRNNHNSEIKEFEKLRIGCKQGTKCLKLRLNSWNNATFKSHKCRVYKLVQRN
jgi:hypothetical protein